MVMRFGDGPRRRRMIRGTIVRIGELELRYGHLSQLAPLDCTSSRRSTVMCALPRATAVTTVYQRDSSSKRPRFVRRLRGPTADEEPAETAEAVDAGERAHSFLENTETFSTVTTGILSGIDNGSFHISRTSRGPPEPARESVQGSRPRGAYNPADHHGQK